MSKQDKLKIYLAISFVAVVSIVRINISYALGQYGVDPSFDVLKARKILGGLDAGSYMQGALSILNGTMSDPSNSFIWNLWPPGMPMLEAFLFKIFGLGISPLVLLSITTVISILIITYFVTQNFIMSKNKIIIAVLGTFLFFSSVVQGWILDQGLMYAEIYQILFLVLAMFAIRNNDFISQKQIILVGVFLFISALFRATGMTILQILLLISIILSLADLVYRFAAKKDSLFENRVNLIFIKIAMISFILSGIWIALRKVVFKVETLNWVITGNNWASYWYKNSDLDKSGWGIVKNIDNWGCFFDKANCVSFNQGGLDMSQLRNQTITFLLNNPIKFLSKRLHDMWDYWNLNGRWLYPPQNRLPESINFLEGVIFILIFLIAIIMAISSLQKPLSMLFLGIVLGTVGPLIIFHLESRYFIPAKFLSVIYIIIRSGELKFKNFISSEKLSI